MRKYVQKRMSEMFHSRHNVENAMCRVRICS